MIEKKKNLMSNTVAQLVHIADQLETLNAAVWDIALELDKMNERMDAFAENIEKSLNTIATVMSSGAVATAETVKKASAVKAVEMPKSTAWVKEIGK